MDSSSASDVFVYHSDDSQIVGDLQEDYGLSLMNLLTDLISNRPPISTHAVEQLVPCMNRPKTREYIRNCFYRSAQEPVPQSLPFLFEDPMRRVILFRKLVDFFPETFSDELTDRQSGRRLKSMSIISSIFKSADELNYPFVFQALELSDFLLSYILSRYKDSDTQVRFEWMKMGFIVLDTSMNTNGIRGEVMERFKHILTRDRTAEIRNQAVIAVRDAVIIKPDFTFDTSLVLALVHRVGDRNSEIRIQALIAMQKVYEYTVLKDPENRYRNKIASCLILLYNKTENSEEKYMMERFLYQSVIRVNDDTPIVWAENIFNAIRRCEDSAVAGIAAALTSGKKIRLLFLQILIAYSEGHKSKVTRLTKKLSLFYDWHVQTSASYLHKLVYLIDEDLFSKLLRLFSDPADMMQDEAGNTLQQFLELTENTDLEDIHFQFLIRSGVVLNDQLMHKKLLRLVEQQLASGTEVTRSCSFLVFWISIYDRFFEEQAVQNFLIPILRRNPACLQILLTKRADLICLPDSFWETCLQPEEDHHSEEESSSSHAGSSSTTFAMDDPSDPEVVNGTTSDKSDSASHVLTMTQTTRHLRERLKT